MQGSIWFILDTFFYIYAANMSNPHSNRICSKLLIRLLLVFKIYRFVFSYDLKTRILEAVI
jgi:hypothetical protein